MVRRLRSDEGFQLIELLIALTILAIGILAIVAGFSSGMIALGNASRASTAATIADKEMEKYRRLAYTPIPSVPQAPTTPTGPDGRTYWMKVDAQYNCPITGSVLDATDPANPTCTAVAGVANRPVKLVTITVRDGSASAKVLVSESSTFDQATG